jgi:hypothetical protein
MFVSAIHARQDLVSDHLVGANPQNVRFKIFQIKVYTELMYGSSVSHQYPPWS